MGHSSQAEGNGGPQFRRQKGRQKAGNPGATGDAQATDASGQAPPALLVFPRPRAGSVQNAIDDLRCGSVNGHPDYRAAPRNARGKWREGAKNAVRNELANLAFTEGRGALERSAPPQQSPCAATGTNHTGR